MTNPRKIEPYIRLLELQAVISEDWGGVIKELNDYLWKGNDVAHLENAQKELQKIVSPLRELESLIELTARRKESQDKTRTE